MGPSPASADRRFGAPFWARRKHSGRVVMSVLRRDVRSARYTPIAYFNTRPDRRNLRSAADTGQIQLDRDTDSLDVLIR
jgi:hypothetical protein